MAQHATAIRNKKIVMRRKHGMTSKEAESTIWDDWSGRGFHVNFSAHETIPLECEDELGSGASGTVYKTFCKGVALAWKSRRNPHPEGLRNTKSLKNLSHLHIVKLVGTFTYKGDLNLLLWPVAVCDLATFLSDLDVFKTSNKLSHFSSTNPNPIHRFTGLGIEATSCLETQESARRWLYQKFGCLAEAISYLHKNKIKHRDLKPSNILLSRKGLWLTDFEISGDFSTLLSSQTNDGGRGTPIYLAPEVADHQLSGRSADIFSLGCIFWEIFWSSCLPNRTREDLRAIRSAEAGSYHANLNPVRHECIINILSITDREIMAAQKLLPLISQMLHPNPRARPQAADIKAQLILIDGFREDGGWSLHGRCCRPVRASSKADWSELKRSLSERNQPFVLAYTQPLSRGRDAPSRYDISPANHQTQHPQLPRGSASGGRRDTYSSDSDPSASSSPAEASNNDEFEALTLPAQAGHGQSRKSFPPQFSAPSLGLVPRRIAQRPAPNEHQLTRATSKQGFAGIGRGMEHQLPRVMLEGGSAARPAALQRSMPSSLHYPRHPEASHAEPDQDVRILDSQPLTKWRPSSNNPYRKFVGVALQKDIVRTASAGTTPNLHRTQSESRARPASIAGELRGVRAGQYAVTQLPDYRESRGKDYSGGIAPTVSRIGEGEVCRVGLGSEQIQGKQDTPIASSFEIPFSRGSQPSSRANQNTTASQFRVDWNRSFHCTETRVDLDENLGRAMDTPDASSTLKSLHTPLLEPNRTTATPSLELLGESRQIPRLQLRHEAADDRMPDGDVKSIPIGSVSIIKLVELTGTAVLRKVVQSVDYLSRRNSPERPIPTNHTRIRWTCKCGERLFDDFIEVRRGAAKELESHLNRHRSRPLGGQSCDASDTSSRTDKTSSHRTSSSATSVDIGSIPFSELNNTNPYYPFRQRNNAGLVTDTTRLGEQHWLHACINERRFTTKLVHLDMHPGRIRSDKDLVMALKDRYLKVKGKWYRKLRLRGLRTIQFVQFEVHHTYVVDIRKCPDMPPEDTSDYSFRAYDLIPPVGEQYLMHLFHHPEDYECEANTYQRIPKKRGTPLEVNRDGGICVGWGINLVEGFLEGRVWTFVSVFFVVASLAFAVTWAVKEGDVQGAFGVAAWICTLGVLFVGWCQACLE